MAKSKAKQEAPHLTDEQKELASKLTKLQYKTIINIECYGMPVVQAYRLAGAKAKGNSAEASVSRMLKLPKVKAFRETFLTQSLAHGVMTREEALQRLTLSAKIKITDVCEFRNVEIGKDGNGDPVHQTVWTIKDAKDIAPEIAACIKSVTITKSGPKIELYDNLTAIKQLSEMQGWNAAQRHIMTGEDGGPMRHEVEAPEIAKAIKDIAKLL